MINLKGSADIMEKKKPCQPKPVPMPKPMPKPPCHPGYPPRPPHHHHHWIPCDKKMLHRLYKYLKMCHRHELNMLKMMMKYCNMHHRMGGCRESSSRKWESSNRRWESPHCDHPRKKPHRPCHPYESSSHHNPYHESSSYRY